MDDLANYGLYFVIAEDGNGVPELRNDDTGLPVTLSDTLVVDGDRYDEKADLTSSGGVLVSSQIPDLAITETDTVADQTERLSLNAEEGDIAIQQDTDETYIFTGGDPSNDSDWSRFQFDVLGAIENQTIDPAAVDFQDANQSNVTHSGSGTITLDLSAANHHVVEATGNVTISFSNVTSAPSVNSVTVYLLDSDGGGPYTVSWPSSFVWAGGSAETEIAANGNLEIGAITDNGGSEWRARPGGVDFA